MLYRTTPLFLKLFGLRTLDDLPETAQWDPSPEDEAALRDRSCAPAGPGEARFGRGVRPLALRGELPAGGVDVAAAGEAHGRAHAVLLEHGLEGRDRAR